jgi:hypothetical protein
MNVWSGLETYSRIKKSPTDAEKDPNIDTKTEAKSQRNVHQDTCARKPAWCLSRDHICDLGSGEREEQEQKGANEFTEKSDEMVPQLVGHP